MAKRGKSLPVLAEVSPIKDKGEGGRERGREGERERERERDVSILYIAHYRN